MKQQKIFLSKNLLTFAIMSLIGNSTFAIENHPGKVYHPIIQENREIIPSLDEGQLNSDTRKVYHPIHMLPIQDEMRITAKDLTPSKVKKAYGFDTITNEGEGQVIAIVAAYDNPNIENDLAVFNNEFGLPACTTANGCFKKIYAKKTAPTVEAGWAVEIALDIEWAHAMAPKAKIILVEAANDGWSELMYATKVAVQKKPTIVSMSWGAREFSGQTDYDDFFNRSNITFVAASGDVGTGPFYPAASPYVLAVGGTQLTVAADGTYLSEVAWSGSGGGLSQIEAWPAHQKNYPIPLANGMRGIPDVAYDASTVFRVYTTAPGTKGGWTSIGGTSVGAPQWAAIIAITNSLLNQNLGVRFPRRLYRVVKSHPQNYHNMFNDITSGQNGNCGYFCTAQEGYDYVTGFGSPNLTGLIPTLTN